MNRRPPVWDLLVVGGGAAGLVGAQTAAGLGADVLLVEQDRTGGECLWTGCVPSKALIAAAGQAAQARRAGTYGVSVGEVSVDFGAVMAHVRRSVTRIAPVDSPEALEQAGVRVLAGTLRFTGPGTADVDGVEVRFRQALIATGSEPLLPRMPGLADVEPLTNETLWDLHALPGRLAVIGAGSTGCEIGQAMARLGSTVTLVETGPRLLAREDPAAAVLVQRALEDDGVLVLTGHSAVAVRATTGQAPGSGVLVLDDGREIDFDRVFVAAGRTPRTHGLGLDALGVRTDRDGSPVVDRSLRTSNPTVWAAGDVTGFPRFSHVAGLHAGLASTNALLGLRRRIDDLNPRVTFTQPELAAVGVPTGSCGPRHRLLEWQHTELDRAVAEGDDTGVTRLVVDRRGRLAGATVVGPRAGETLGELGTAVRQRTSVLRMATTPHAYPTYNDGPWNAVIDEVRRRLAGPTTQRAIGVAVGLRRRWLDRGSVTTRRSA
ncbi:dihydrolipoyl dehydrogenase family protein [Nocardioides sambongensis]|uniref:dihydrolipoyl dehydrogenase family protein n=1 Tax=Nocardioides sambongensis TaxID=2589074 RepID=UPI001E44FA0B|nr:FAD-dependent oxidoreductase [Nocardioides sambongensis]